MAAFDEITSNMKTTSHAGQVAVWLILGCFLWIGSGRLILAAEEKENETQMAFQKGRTLFFEGKMEEARPWLEKVLVANPTHVETQAMLARIQLQAKQVPNLADRYAKLIVPRIEFEDVSVKDALTGLRKLAEAASDGKVVPNFVIKDADLGDTLISLNLTDVPLTEAIRYISELSHLKVRYEANAVLLVPAAG